MPELDPRWQATCAYLGFRYTIKVTDDGGLLLKPMRPWLLRRALISPLDEARESLMISIEADDAGDWRIRQRLERLTYSLPAQPRIAVDRGPGGPTFYDLVMPLDLVLGVATDAAEQEAHLFLQIPPIFNALDLYYCMGDDD